MRSPKHPAPPIDNAEQQRHMKTGDVQRQMTHKVTHDGEVTRKEEGTCEEEGTCDGEVTREEEATCDEESTCNDNGMPTRNDNG